MRVYWMLIAALFAVSGFFGVQAERTRRALQRAEAEVQTGELVTLGSILDGDTVLMKSATGESVTVRIVGIKAFSAEATRDDSLPYGREAISALHNALDGKPIRVMLHSTKKDVHGRTLASLYAEGEDVAVTLLRQGLVLVYTAYPFPAMSLYLNEQSLAREAKRGIWSSPGSTARADGLAREWSLEAP
jgi:endonuclease YncB( thermonuclease family)